MAMNHNGMGASLAAPKGPSEQEIVVDAAQNALISTLDIDAVECHGAGAYLADAIEISSLMRAHRTEENNEPLALMATKSNAGNMVWTAGLTAFLKNLWNAQRSVMNPVCHLHTINPHVDIMEESPALVLTEAASYRSQMGSYTGIMSKGFGGTNVYAITRGAPPQEAEESQNHENMLGYWPGGGGSLVSTCLPAKDYQIAGAFNSWTPEPMTEIQPERDGDRSFAFVLQLPKEETSEDIPEFQIWLDGDSERVLHPEWQQAYSGAGVAGPHSQAQAYGFTWSVCPWKLHSAEDGNESDKYRIVLRVVGMWRSVTWSKIR
jgi:hypothetical protein